MLPSLKGSHTCWACRAYVLAAGAPGLLLWCAGVPALFAWVLWRERRRGRLNTPRVAAAYGFLYAGYRERTFWWESTIMLRKLAVVAATTLVPAHAQDLLRLILCLGVVWIALLLQARPLLPQ